MTTLIAEVDSSIIVTLDGETLEETNVHRAEDGELYVDAMPIFKTLGNQVNFDETSSALIVRRAQDGVVMELFTDSGLVKADGKTLGRLDAFGEITRDSFIMTPNAIAVMSGAAGEFDIDNNRFDFELDPRLRVTTGFEIILNGAPIGALEPPPRAVGPIMLLPLLPLADELGHIVTVIDGGSAVKVVRNQDSAIFVLNLDTGLITLFDTPIGLSKDVSYIDVTNLMIPTSAFEALTGTNVVPGESGQILIDLDSRLKDVIQPDGDIRDVAKDSGLKIEHIAFEAGPQSVNRIEIGGHNGAFNGRLRAELARMPSELRELEPDWLSLDYHHISGVHGSIGDYLARYRELDGVNVSRIQGVSAQKETEKGRWSLAAGRPVVDVREVSEDQTRLVFGGTVAGVRYADRDGWEAGLAARHDGLSDDQMAVLSAISGRLGRKTGAKTQWDAEASLGVFNGLQRKSSFDVEARGQVRRKLTATLDLDMNATYSGAEFQRSIIRQDTLDKTVSDVASAKSEFLPDFANESLDRGGAGIALTYRNNTKTGPFDALSVSARYSHDRVGVRRMNDQAARTDVVAANASAVIAGTDLSLSASATHYKSRLGLDAETQAGTQLSVNAFKPIGSYTVRTRLDLTDESAKEAGLSGSLDVAREAVRIALPKGAGVSLSPSVSALYQNDGWSLRGGVYASANSGDWFGAKTQVSASLGVIQSANARTSGQFDRFMTVSIARRLRVGDHMSVGLAYRADLQGYQQLGLLLSGRYDFNARRRLVDTEPDTGLLQGQAFIDENADGIRQPGEIGAGGIVVRLKGSRYALRTDPSGAFTIQNLRKGVYNLQIDTGSLPLGYGMDDKLKARVAVKDGQLTSVDLPIQRFGQIRGAVFVDDNGNGSYDRGETRIEGATVDLVGVRGEVETTGSTSFGQFAFDQLGYGTYQVTVRASQALSIDESRSLEVTVGEDENGQARIYIPVERKPAKTMLAEQETPQLGLSPNTQSTGLPPP